MFNADLLGMGDDFLLFPSRISSAEDYRHLSNLGEWGEEIIQGEGAETRKEKQEEQEGHQEGRGKDKQEVKHILHL